MLFVGTLQADVAAPAHSDKWLDLKYIPITEGVSFSDEAPFGEVTVAMMGLGMPQPPG